MPGLGLIDPCPLWDDDGRAWLVFAWAKSRSGVNNRLSMVEISPDARTVLGPPVTVIDGDAVPGYSILEGPKLYKRDGWYWIFAPAGGVANGWQSAFRSRSVLGPYEGRIVLAQGDTLVNGPHQGAWVTSPEGEDWFLHFQQRDPFGRVLHLQPLHWDDEGWPVIGDDGHPVLEYPAPARARHSPPFCPAQSDNFRATQPAPQWYWQANPGPDWLTLAGDGLARLRAVPNDLGNLRTIPQILGRQLHGAPSDQTTSLHLDATAPGTRAGLVVLGEDYAYIGLIRDTDGIWVESRTYTPGQGETVRFRAQLPGPATPVQLRASSTDEGLCTFRFRTTPDEKWTTALDSFQALPALWTSAELGLFAAAPPGTPGTGQAFFGAVAAP